MDFIWLVVGGIAGLLASLILKTDAQHGMVPNVLAGIVGALLAGWTISPLLDVGTINQGFSMGALLVSLLGAVTLLAIVNSVWRGSMR